MQNLVEHHASVMVNAPVHQVYRLFSHFNDFPKFMSFVKEVTYYDEQHSHWVAEVAGQHEWDAMNEDWITDRQIGWRSTRGLQNYGRVIFQPVAASQTRVDVYINYNPPGGFLGSISERLGVGKRFDDVLQNDLINFAKMVDLAPANAEDPQWSSYLFHPESAVARGTTTERQNMTMDDGFASPETAYGYTPGPSSPPHPDLSVSTHEDALIDRPILDRDIVGEPINTAPENRQVTRIGKPGYPGSRNADMLPESAGENERPLPPERMPRQDYPADNSTLP